MPAAASPSRHLTWGSRPASSAWAETGIVAVAVRNSHHAGALGWIVERLAVAGMVALAFTNSPAAIAPWGGTTALFGTNPIAFAAPRAGQAPLVIDASLSKVARGRIMVAAQRGEPIPEGWALDPEGRPTTDAKAALAGAMLPLGEAKGAALVLMVEVLAAVLTGGRFGFEASSFFTAEGPPPRIGQLLLLLDPTSTGGPEVADRLDTLLAAILGQPGTRLPGEPPARGARQGGPRRHRHPPGPSRRAAPPRRHLSPFTPARGAAPSSRFSAPSRWS